MDTLYHRNAAVPDDAHRHLSDEQLLALVDGRASIDDHAAHLDACESCRSVLAVAREAAPSPPAVHLHVGRYEVRGLLGEGGMGVVYRAWDPEIQREVALKVWACAGADARDRLLHEARVMGRLSHPSLATVYDVGFDPAFGAFIATRLIDGETLRRWARYDRSARARDRLRVVVEVAEAVALAHDAGVVHGDLKPDNILMRAGKEPVVCDFGLAHVDGAGPRGGTPGYAAPELATEGASTKADQYAFCVLASELSLPSRLDPVWARGMRSDPATRWPDMHALIRAVRRRRRGPAWLLGVSALAVGVTSMAWVRAPNPGCLLDPEGTRARWRVLRSERPLGERPLAALDTYVERWVVASKTACNAGSDHPCLSSARAELEELLTRLESSDRVDVVPWVAQLPDPSACEADAAAHVRAPALAEARALRLDGDPRAAASIAGRIALSTEDERLAAEAELLRGKALVGVDPDAARDSLWRATVSASAVGRPDLQAEAMLGLALLELRDPARASQAARLIERAAALTQRHRLPLEPAVRYLQGMLASAQGDREAALTAIAHADALARAQLRAGHPFRFTYAFEHAVALARLGRHEAAAQKLEVIAKQSHDILGPEHPRTAIVDAELGSQLANLGRWSSAEPRLQAAIDHLEAKLGESSPLVLDTRYALALVANERGRSREAHDAFLELHRRNDASGRHKAALDARCAAADAQLEFATLAEARAGYVEALQYAKAQQLPESASARCLARRASIDRQRSDPSAAHALRHAAQLLDETDADPLDRAFARFELAQAEDDPRRAREALDVLPAEGAVAERLRVQITGWLEQHGS